MAKSKDTRYARGLGVIGEDGKLTKSSADFPARSCGPFSKENQPPRIKGDPRLCQAKFKNTPERWCKQWAANGSRYCRFHGGHMRTKQNGGRGGATKSRLSKLPALYRKVISKSLHDALEEQLGIKPSDQLSILDELALMRDFASQSVALYSAARESGKPQAVMGAGAFMCELLQKVAKTAEQAAKITSQTSDTYSIHDLQYVVNQLIHILHRCVPEGQEHIAIEFEAKVKEQLVLPNQPEGVASEPHHDVEEIDSMVPKLTEVQDATT